MAQERRHFFLVPLEAQVELLSLVSLFEQLLPLGEADFAELKREVVANIIDALAGSSLFALLAESVEVVGSRGQNLVGHEQPVVVGTVGQLAVDCCLAASGDLAGVRGDASEVDDWRIEVGPMLE